MSNMFSVKAPPPVNSTGPLQVTSMTTLSEEDALRLLMMRLRVPQGSRYPFEHISLHLNNTKSYVFVVSSGGAVVLEDDPHMFPSDELIAKLQVLKG